MDIKLNPIFRETYTLGDVGVKEKGYTSRKPAWDATPARQYVRSGALRRARRTGFIGIIASVAGTAVRTVPRTRLSENEKKTISRTYHEKMKMPENSCLNDKKCE